MNVSEELRETLERVSAMRREQEETQQRSYELQREWGWQS